MIEEVQPIYAPPDKGLIEALAHLVEVTKGTKAEDAVAELVAHMAHPVVIGQRAVS